VAFAGDLVSKWGRPPGNTAITRRFRPQSMRYAGPIMDPQEGVPGNHAASTGDPMPPLC